MSMPIMSYTSTKEKAGTLHNLDITSGKVLVFQLPRPTKMLSDTYVQNAKSALDNVLPLGVNAIIIGSDINVYAMCPEDAVTLVLKRHP